MKRIEEVNFVMDSHQLQKHLTLGHLIKSFLNAEELAEATVFLTLLLLDKLPKEMTSIKHGKETTACFFNKQQNSY